AQFLVSDCEARGDLKPVCGLQAPEDLAVLPDQRHILLSQFGNMGDHPGSIGLFDTDTESTRILFPNQEPASHTELWGDAACATPPGSKFSPHGTHLHQLADGRRRYLVINHGAREAVEMFALRGKGRTSNLQWRGCVIAPEDAMTNDVVGLADGSVIFTKMHAKEESFYFAKVMLGMNTGEVWRWDVNDGLKVLPETTASLPNGLEISSDERFLFINAYANNEVRKYDLLAQRTVAVADVKSIDNSAWNSDGKLWVASHTGGMREIVACFKDPRKTCGLAFEIVAIEPENMRAKTVFAHEGAPMGAATVAVRAGDAVYMGSFIGDRLLRAPVASFVE
ncbi:MAG: SMP-30/gluconolactonase/LRE family protein, partial [Pseudomonadales bacterium]